MNTKIFYAIIGCGCLLLTPNRSYAQESIEIEDVAIETSAAECKMHYTSSWRDNWFIQFGAGAQMPFVDYSKVNGNRDRHITAVYNLGVGHWFSPYLGFRFSGYYGKMHWDFERFNSAQMANLNFDFMWDMTSSVCGVNPNRVFSFIPFVGLGGTYTWDFKGASPSIGDGHGHMKTREWTLPVSAGVQMRFRLCKYADFFAEARANFYGDNFNNAVGGAPIEANITAIGGFSFTIGGRDFKSYNPCNYPDYVNSLNDQVNELRTELEETAAALAVAESQLPCPDTVEQIVTVQQTPLMSTVHFKINSADINGQEMINVYNVAQWMKANPEATVTVNGYADRNTGSSDYNMKLSQRRAQAVVDILTGQYGIDSSRLKIKASGSDSQPYGENDWNRIVIFSQP